MTAADGVALGGAGRAKVRVTALDAGIEGFYSPRRRHSTLGYRSPAKFNDYNSDQRSSAGWADVYSTGFSAIGAYP